MLLLLLLVPGITCHPWEHARDDQFNKGWSAYLDDEYSSFYSLPLTWSGNTSIPAWVQGSYIKNGPARKQFGDERYYSSWLDSWGKLHKFTFNGESVLFSGRMIETRNYNKSVGNDKMLPTVTLGKVVPDWTPLEAMEGVVNGYDNTNVLVWKLGPADRDIGQYIAVTDYPHVWEIDPDTLAVREMWGLNQLTEGISMGSCAHWRREVGRNTSLNFHQIYNPLTLHPDFVLYRFGNTFEEREVVGRFHMPHMSLVHMFSNTENFAVITLYPVSMNFWSMASHNMHPFETVEKIDAPTRIYLVDLRDGSVIDGFESSDPSLVYATHYMNAWEEGDEVVFDLATNPWDAIVSFFDLNAMLHHPETNNEKADFLMKRVRLNRKTKTVLLEDWPNQQGIPLLNTVDFPVINNKFNGLKNRYAYGWVTIDYWRNTLVKKDLEDSMNDKTWFRPSHYPGELFFIPRPDGDAEDDGVLVTVVFDGEKEQSYLLVLDGQTFEEINWSYLPHNVPFSFHGNWFPELH